MVARNTSLKAKECLSQTESDAGASSSVKIKLETVRSTIDKKQSFIAKLNQEIENLYSEDEIEKEITDRREFENEIEGILCNINAILRLTDMRQVRSENARQSSSSVKVKLPTLTLSRFDGNPTQWEAFWDSFQSTIDTNTELSNIDKLKHLQNSLIGESVQTLAGLQITSENYKEAIELLQKRYVKTKSFYHDT